MDSISTASLHAVYLLFSGDKELWNIISISFSVSLRAILFAAPLAVLIAFAMAYHRFFGRRVLIYVFNTLLSVPAVIIGLTLYIIFSRNGPLGDLKLLFTQDAMIIGQFILCMPLILIMSHTTFQSSDRRIWETARTLGATRIQAMLTVMYEIRFGLLAALIAGFGRIIAEVGCSMMIGGNILHYTRNIPTAIALETSKGDFSQGIALGIVLLVMAMVLNLSLSLLQGRGEVV
ncbi:MAG: ABC transporter permease [Gammaproteobacteria bacterium]|nr:ABC transporter permease [Gammaproteobacteria bacterium]